MTVLDSKPTKSVGHFEESKFFVGCHQFLLECCPKLIKTYNFGQKAVNKRQLKNKNEQLGCLFSKLPRLFVDFLSKIVGIFYRVERTMIGIPEGFWVMKWKLLYTYHQSQWIWNRTKRMNLLRTPRQSYYGRFKSL